MPGVREVILTKLVNWTLNIVSLHSSDAFHSGGFLSIHSFLVHSSFGHFHLGLSHSGDFHSDGSDESTRSITRFGGFFFFGGSLLPLSGFK
jgi:hypothetical protein